MVVEKGEESFEVIDGTSRSDEVNPALEDNESFLDDGKIDKNIENKKNDKDKEEDDDDIEDIDLEDVDGEDDGEDDDNLDDDKDDDKNDKDTDSEDEAKEAENLEIENKISESQVELQRIKREFATVIKRSDVAKKPTEPKKDEYGEADESEQRRYEIKLATWESKQDDYIAEHEELKEEMKVAAKKQEADFRRANAGKDLIPFEAYLKEKDYLYYAYINGDETLSDLYKDYQRRHGQDSKDKKEVENLKKTGGKIRKISTKTKGTSNYGGNGIPSKYKYSNLAVFKDIVKHMQKKKVGLDGRRFTNERIEKLCKQEYNDLKGIPQV